MFTMVCGGHSWHIPAIEKLEPTHVAQPNLSAVGRGPVEGARARKSRAFEPSVARDGVLTREFNGGAAMNGKGAVDRVGTPYTAPKYFTDDDASGEHGEYKRVSFSSAWSEHRQAWKERRRIVRTAESKQADGLRRPRPFHSEINSKNDLGRHPESDSVQT